MGGMPIGRLVPTDPSEPRPSTRRGIVQFRPGPQELGARGWERSPPTTDPSPPPHRPRYPARRASARIAEIAATLSPNRFASKVRSLSEGASWMSRICSSESFGQRCRGVTVRGGSFADCRAVSAARSAARGDRSRFAHRTQCRDPAEIGRPHDGQKFTSGGGLMHDPLWTRPIGGAAGSQWYQMVLARWKGVNH